MDFECYSYNGSWPNGVTCRPPKLSGHRQSLNPTQPWPLSFVGNMYLSGGASDKEPVCQCSRLERCGFDLWVGKVP